MFEVQTKIKRQVEILGLIIDNPGFKTFDLAEKFSVEELTIKRDLQDLRSYGIDIHSHKKNGVCVNSSIDKQKISECIAYYTGIINPVSLAEKATIKLVEKRGTSALKNMVLLQKCIEDCLIARIKYNKEGDVISEKLVKPLLIYHNDGNWRVLIKDEDTFKQLILFKIIEVIPTERKFQKIDDSEFENLFKFSWKSWIGEEKYCIKLELSDSWAENLKTRIFMPDQKLYKNEEGKNIFEATVNSLAEVTTWIISFGKGIKVISPEELKSRVISVAGEVLSNYFEEEIV
jgi:predicted DNA-binding transcriptional regulator YafY